jgi:hypothetical protein
MNQKAHNPGSPGPEEKDLDAEIRTIRAESTPIPSYPITPAKKVK